MRDKLKIKVRVHISNEDYFMDEKVFADVYLPAYPRIGERLIISVNAWNELTKKIFNDLKHAQNYLHLIYGCECKHIKKENLKNLDFGNYNYISDVLYVADEDLIHVQLDDGETKYGLNG
jgi:hypothetical protein